MDLHSDDDGQKSCLEYDFHYFEAHEFQNFNQVCDDARHLNYKSQTFLNIDISELQFSKVQNFFD